MSRKNVSNGNPFISQGDDKGSTKLAQTWYTSLKQLIISAESYPDPRYVSSLQRGLWESDPINLSLKGLLASQDLISKHKYKMTVIPWELNCTFILYHKL